MAPGLRCSLLAMTLTGAPWLKDSINVCSSVSLHGSYALVSERLIVLVSSSVDVEWGVEWDVNWVVEYLDDRGVDEGCFWWVTGSRPPKRFRSTIDCW